MGAVREPLPAYVRALEQLKSSRSAGTRATAVARVFYRHVQLPQPIILQVYRKVHKYSSY